MSIRFEQSDNTLTLQTLSSTYQMKADGLGTLLHTWYGAKTEGEDMSVMIRRMDRGFMGNPHEIGSYDRSYSPDALPQEISAFGTGDYRITSLRVENGDGSRTLRLKYDSHRILKGKYEIPGLPASYGTDRDAQTLVVTLKDEASKVEAELFYGVFEKSDVITRAVRITNHETAPVKLLNPGSLTLDFVTGEYDLLTFCGSWANERMPVRRHLEQGITAVGSVRGASSHQYNPSCILCTPETTEANGEAWGLALVYSGEFLLRAERDSLGQTRLDMGIHPDNFTWTLEEGESFMTPEVIMTYSDGGFEKLSLTMHAFIREHVIPAQWLDRERPVLINNWEGTYFNFTGEKLISIAEDAADLGLGLFVLDDGWFGKRNDDNAGLGDWYPNEAKLGMTMAELGLCIRSAGVRFGLWFEPEMINEDSDLFRAHPDWAVAVPGREPTLSRNQLVLDLCRKEVQDYLLERMEALIKEAGLSYIKWDFNRSMCDKYTAALPPERQGEMAHRFMLGTYRVLRELTEKYPDLLIEGCSGGGGRFDCGMLCFTPQIWCSDNTDPIERLAIQTGTSMIYPVSAVGAHVSASPNHQTGRRTPFRTRAAVAMSGSFGYELDTAALTEEEKEQIRKDTAFYKEHALLFKNGRYFRLLPPEKGASAVVWEQTDANGHQAVVTAVSYRAHANMPPVYVRLKGLKHYAHYRLRFQEGHGPDLKGLTEAQKLLFTGKTPVRGDVLMNRGIFLPDFREEYDSFILILERV